MAGPKEWAHVEMLVDASRVFELIKWCEGKTLKPPEIRAVRHGGEDEETGEIKPRPSARALILAFAQAHPTFNVGDIAREGQERYGFAKTGITSTIHTMLKEKNLKRVGVGQYALSAKAAAKTINGHAAPPAAAIVARPHKKRSEEGSTRTDKILAYLKANSKEEGIAVSEIVNAVPGLKSNNVSGAFTSLVKWGQIKKVSLGHYVAI